MSKGFSKWDYDGWKFCWWVIYLVGCVNSGSYRVECDGEKAGFKAEIARNPVFGVIIDRSPLFLVPV